jgi:hypothetical protein
VPKSTKKVLKFKEPLAGIPSYPKKVNVSIGLSNDFFWCLGVGLYKKLCDDKLEVIKISREVRININIYEALCLHFNYIASFWNDVTSELRP